MADWIAAQLKRGVPIKGGDECTCDAHVSLLTIQYKLCGHKSTLWTCIYFLFMWTIHKHMIYTLGYSWTPAVTRQYLLLIIFEIVKCAYGNISNDSYHNYWNSSYIFNVAYINFVLCFSDYPGWFYKLHLTLPTNDHFIHNFRLCAPESKSLEHRSYLPHEENTANKHKSVANNCFAEQFQQKFKKPITEQTFFSFR